MHKTLKSFYRNKSIQDKRKLFDMKQLTRITIKTLCLGIILGTSVLSMAQMTGKENEKLIPFGDFNSWMVRIIDESFVIGGNTKTYRIYPNG